MNYFALEVVEAVGLFGCLIVRPLGCWAVGLLSCWAVGLLAEREPWRFNDSLGSNPNSTAELLI